jgi:excisionase family DNA binding protein
MTTHVAAPLSVTTLPPFLATTQVAVLLGLHPATLRQWRHQRRGIPYCKIGGAVRYSREAVLAYIADRTRPVGTAEAEAGPGVEP